MWGSILIYKYNNNRLNNLIRHNYDLGLKKKKRQKKHIKKKLKKKNYQKKKITKKKNYKKRKKTKKKLQKKKKKNFLRTDRQTDGQTDNPKL